MGFDAFSKVVKSMKLVVQTHTERFETELPLNAFDTPISAYKIKFEENKS
jgi:hypothetical protein